MDDRLPKDFLTKRERAEFKDLVGRLGPVPGFGPRLSSLGLVTRVRLAFWRHLHAAVVLVPVGLMVMMAALPYRWPLGLFGAPMVGIGLLATFELVRSRRFRRRRGRRPQERSSP